MAVVGIDLGTTNTVIAAVRDGRATALKDKVGRALLPSVVSFTAKGAVKVGYEAKDRRTIDPENTVFSIKRLIGRTFDSEHVQKARGRLPFELKEGPGKSVLVSCYGQDYTLPEISALVLGQAQKIAEARLGSSASDAVITVPANFNDLQRAATKVAGRTAGLEVLRIINEPTAAALAYGFGKTGRERIAVYDFGGGTFDVTLLDLSENVFEVLATAGDTFLGGDDIDRAIMDRMAEELLKKQKVDAEEDNLVREQLRAAAERLKIDLSTRSMGKVNIEELDFEFSLRRSEFEALTEPLLARTLEVCQEAMDVAGITKRDLDQVLLVGGSTRIPLVRRRISSFFGKMPQSRINPDEVVAIGASIQASSLEAKQAGASIPAAPRGRASHHPSRAPSPLGAPTGGTTQTGLAGLKRTSPGGVLLSPGTTENSVLSGLKSVPPSVHPAGPGQKLGPAKTLAGVGPSGHASSPPPKFADSPRPPHKTLSGVGTEESPLERKRSNTLAGLTERGKGSTNLGLGGASPSSPPPMIGQAPPSARKEEEFFPREKQGTLPGAAAPEAGMDEGDEITDGSVTFDLSALEATEGEEDASGFESLNEETTAVVEPAQVAALAAGSIQDLGESALMSMEEIDLDDEADLPMPVSSVRSEEELSSSALLSLDDDAFAEDDLPSLATDLPSPRAKSVALGSTTVGLPSPVEQLPTVAHGLPAVPLHLPERASEEAALPLVGHHTPELPQRKGPLPGRSASAEHRLGLDRTQIGVAPAAPDFGSATGPSVEELDELSVAALLPEDPEEDADPDPLEFGLGGGTLPLPRNQLAAPPPPAPNPALDRTSPFGSQPMTEDSAPAFQLSPRPLPEAPLAGVTVAHPADAPRPMGSPLLLDVTPLSLGVEVTGGYVDKLIQRNSPIPCEMTRTFATAQDNQAVVRVRVSQGEADRFDRNTILGEVQLTGLSQGPRGSVKVDVSFSLDESGMLQVSARDQATGNAANARLMLQGVSQ